MNSSWGPLGNPTKEQIQKWCDMPYGHFTAYIKPLVRKKKGRQLKEHTVYVIKEIAECFVAESKVFGYDINDALSKLRYSCTLKDLPFGTTPYKTGVVSYQVTGFNPTPKTETNQGSENENS